MIFQLKLIKFLCLSSVCEHSQDFNLGTKIQDGGKM